MVGYTLLVDIFARSLRVCHLEFDKEFILVVIGVKIAGMGREGFEFLEILYLLLLYLDI